MRRFTLQQTGSPDPLTLAEGVVFTGGSPVALRWLYPGDSLQPLIVFYGEAEILKLEQAEGTRLVWLDK